MMKKKHREILSELCAICNQMGANLDYTATHESKLKDRQQAHMLVHHVLFGVLVDNPENDQAEDDMKKAIESIEGLKRLQAKTYPDRNNYLQPLEQHP
jgi:hypothetical protein